MAENDGLKLAIEDVRARSTALLQLIYMTDRQAMALLRLYVTIGVAAVSGGFAGLKGLAAIPHVAALGLFGAAAVLFVGSIFCFHAMQTAEVGLPGRGPEFWKWALETEGVSLTQATSQYLKDLGDKIELSRKVNKKGSAALRIAKKAGIAAPAVALLIGAGAWMLGY